MKMNRDNVEKIVKQVERVRSVLNDEGKEKLTKRQMEDILWTVIIELENHAVEDFNNSIKGGN